MEKFKVLLERVILSYPHLIEKQPIDNVYITTVEKQKYTATFLLDKSNPKHMEAVNEMQEKLKSLLALIKIKKNPHDLIKDGDEEYEAIEDKDKKLKNEYKKGKFIITAANYRQPTLQAGRDKEFKIDEHKELFYPGCYVHALIELAPYQFNKAWKGVSNRLQQVRFSANGESIVSGGRITANEEMDKFVDADEDILF